MRTSPAPTLLRAVGAWVGLALGLVLWPWLWPLPFAAAVLLAAFVVSDAASLRGQPDLTIRRELPNRAHEGRETGVSLVVENPGPRPVTAQVFEDAPPDLAASVLEHPAVRVPERGRAVLEYTVTPLRRGDHELGRPMLLARSPLGLLRRRSEGEPGDLLSVYPDTTRFLRPEALDPRRVLARLGARPARRRGDGLEFESLRDYVPGDDPRRLDWAASARRARPVVRLHQHERNHTVLIAIDASRLMAARTDHRTKLDHVIEASLALTYASLLCGDRVAMTVYDREVRGYLTPRADRRDLGDFVELLRRVQPRLVEADFRELVRNVRLRQRQRALVVIFTDFVEVDSEGLYRSLSLLGRQHRVLLVAVRDPLYAELDPSALQGRTTPTAGYRRIVLDELLRSRETALIALRRAGLHTLDLPPDRITAAVLNRYLEIRYGAER